MRLSEDDAKPGTLLHMEAGRGRDSGASFEAVLDKKLLGVNNTMDSIQGLSAWCIEYKKYHGMIVRQWIKCLKNCKWQYLFRSRDVGDHSVAPVACQWESEKSYSDYLANEWLKAS